MLVERINHFRDLFKAHLHSGKIDPYKWRSLRVFADNWNMEAQRFGAMYAASFHSTLANDLWEGHDYYPRRAMLQMIERDPDLVRQMFKELFDERLEIEGRIDRFLYHCEAIREDMLRSDDSYQKHYHENYRMISVYLAFRFPQQYCIYDYAKWRKFMQLTGATQVPDEYQVGRFFKVMRTVGTLLYRDDELPDLIQEILKPYSIDPPGKDLLLVAEFYEFVADRSNHTPGTP